MGLLNLPNPVFTTQQRVLDPWGPKCAPSDADTGWVGDRGSPPEGGILPTFSGALFASTIWEVAWNGGPVCGLWKMRSTGNIWGAWEDGKQ